MGCSRQCLSSNFQKEINKMAYKQKIGRKDRMIKPIIKTDKGFLYEIDGMQGLYEIKSYDKKSKRFIFKKV
jgi:hypothetical protein